MHNPELGIEFDAVNEARQHRMYVVGMAESLLANMTAVQRGLTEMSMQTPHTFQNDQDNVTDLDTYRGPKKLNLNIVEQTNSGDLADSARDWIDKIGA